MEMLSVPAELPATKPTPERAVALAVMAVAAE